MTIKHSWKYRESNYYFNVILDEKTVIKLEKPLDRKQLQQNYVNA